MPPDVDSQMPILELNDQMVTADDDLQPVIDHASHIACEDQETSNFKLQMRLDSLGAYYPCSILPLLKAPQKTRC